jgi:hypothetical protein
MLVHNGPELFSNFLSGLVPRDLLKIITDPLQRVSQALVMVLMIAHIQALSADISRTAWVAFIRPYFD